MVAATGRAIGVWGTATRILLGLVLVGSVQARRNPGPMRATGPLGHTINIAVFLVLYLTWWYAPAVDVLSDAALIFYGASMLLAAARGYAGCEVLAVSNALLRRDDQIGCAPFWPIDAAETRRPQRRTVTVTDGGGDER